MFDVVLLGVIINKIISLNIVFYLFYRHGFRLHLYSRVYQSGESYMVQPLPEKFSISARPLDFENNKKKLTKLNIFNLCFIKLLEHCIFFNN